MIHPKSMLNCGRASLPVPGLCRMACALGRRNLGGTVGVTTVKSHGTPYDVQIPNNATGMTSSFYNHLKLYVNI